MFHPFEAGDSLIASIRHLEEDPSLSGVRARIGQLTFTEGGIHAAELAGLSAVETLARVRKLALPFLQLNIDRNQQVNMAGPMGGCLQ
jgi:hypothetical protein